MRTSTCSAIFIASALIVVFSQPSSVFGQGQDESKQLTSAFTLVSSPQAQYAQTLDEASFYAQLYVVNLRQDLTGAKCVDRNFFTWVRKFFKKDAKSISIVASVMMPDNTTHKIPLFQI
jgi:hypothetical protein